MKLSDIERLLFGREVGEQRGDGFGDWGEEEIGVPGGGDEGDAVGVVELVQQVGFAVGAGKGFDGEVLLGFDGELRRAEVGQVEGDAVRGQDGDAGGFDVDEGHHHGRFREGGDWQAFGDGGGGFRVEAEGGGALLHVGGGGFVAVVAIGDEEPLVGHGVEDELDEGGVGEFPDAMLDAVLVGDFELGRGAGLKDGSFGGEGGVGVEHVDLLAVGAGGFEEGEAVGLVLGESLLVAVDDFVGVVVELAEADEPAALTNFFGAGDLVGLGVAEEGGLGLFLEDAFGAPLVERGGGAGVDVFAVFGVGGELFAEDHADEVVGARLVVAVLHFGGDFVVGLSDNVSHVHERGVVTEGAERVKAGHSEEYRG